MQDSVLMQLPVMKTITIKLAPWHFGNWCGAFWEWHSSLRTFVICRTFDSPRDDSFPTLVKLVKLCSRGQSLALIHCIISTHYKMKIMGPPFVCVCVCVCVCVRARVRKILRVVWVLCSPTGARETRGPIWGLDWGSDVA